MFMFLRYCKIYSRVCQHLHRYYIRILKEMRSLLCFELFHFTQDCWPSQINSFIKHNIFFNCTLQYYLQAHIRYSVLLPNCLAIMQESKLKNVILTCMAYRKSPQIFNHSHSTKCDYFKHNCNDSSLFPDSKLFNNQHFNNFKTYCRMHHDYCIFCNVLFIKLTCHYHSCGLSFC